MTRRSASIARLDACARRKVEPCLTISWCWPPGSYPFVPPIPGRERPNCFVYRTIEISKRSALAAAQSKVGVVIGGGLLGLEAAKALCDLGLKTHVVEFAPRLMAVQIDDGGGRVLRQKIAEMDVGIHTGKSTDAPSSTASSAVIA